MRSAGRLPELTYTGDERGDDHEAGADDREPDVSSVLGLYPLLRQRRAQAERGGCSRRVKPPAAGVDRLSSGREPEGPERVV